MRIALIVGLLSAAASARAIRTDVGTANAQFLQIGAGARSLGMGGAYTAAAEGPDAAYWNPAGLADMTRPEATYARTELPAGLHHDFLAVAVPSGFQPGTLAIAATRLSQDSIDLVNASNQTQGRFSPHSEVFALAYGFSLAGANDNATTTRDYFRDDWNVPRAKNRPLDVEEWGPPTGGISLGASAKYIHENLGTRSAAAFAADGGGLFRPSDLPELIVAGAFRNIGSKLTFISDPRPLPAELALSVAYDARADDWRFLPALEIDAPYADAVYGRVGFEATKKIRSSERAAMRLGYTSVSAADLGVLSGVTMGAGLKIGKFAFDAAFQPMELLGESFRLSVGWRF